MSERAYADPAAPGNSREYLTGKPCIELGCAKSAGTAWSRLWCWECNRDRMDRITHALEQLAELPAAIVVNVRHEPFDVRIDRMSKWGNPFRIGVDGDRAEVIAKYREYIQTRPDLLAALPELRGKRLGCWCKPEACHGDVLVALLEDNNAH